MSTETLRAAFEAWAAKETPPYRLERVLVPVSDLYAWNSTACAWEAFQAGAIAAAKQAEPVAQWVSVQERLPESEGPYVIFRPTAHLPPACDPNVVMRNFKGGRFEGLHDVTHWMPLPPTPAAAKGESS